MGPRVCGAAHMPPGAVLDRFQGAAPTYRPAGLYEDGPRAGPRLRAGPGFCAPRTGGKSCVWVLKFRDFELGLFFCIRTVAPFFML